jgi:hypothetical protein
MVIKDLFAKGIDRTIQGVVTIGNESEEQKWQELEEYVCTDEITKSFRTFFRRYRESIAHPTEKMGVWITGFFGSGKSHFLKILGYLLENEVVAGVNAVDYFDNKISDSLVLADIKQAAKANNKVVLFNIDSKAKSDSKNRTQAIMDIMLRAFNEAIGYCGSMPWVADMERALDDEGVYVKFIEEFQKISNKNWKQNRSKALLNRDYIIAALVSARNMTEESARKFIDDQVRNYTQTTEDFAKLVDAYCRNKKARVVFLMDEVGQFIGTDGELMLNLQTCVEDLGKFCKGQAWVIVTSQQELRAMIESNKAKQNDFSKIQGRFDTRLLLSGANADKVIKKRILEKKDTAVTPLKSLYDTNASKLSNLILFQAKPTWSGYKDAEEFKDVYPFVSYQFELLQKVFESIREHGMSEGKHLSQNERSLLSAFQESAKNIATKEAGLLVPFDSFYTTIEQFIDYDIKTVFTTAVNKIGLNNFSIRVLRLLFMIKHVKEMPATIDRIATLMVESVYEDKAALKDKILEALKNLEAETLIQKNGEEYDFLTNTEQDVNRQINTYAYNEGEVQRNILDIIYDRVLDNNKLLYENRYSFIINRYVDQESKGAFNADNITIRVLTDYSGIREETSFAAESARNNEVIVDLTGGSYIEELIKANRIAAFSRNNCANMSASLAEIMSKKSAEKSDRMKRAEELIKNALRTAAIYIAGNKLDIKEKDGKDRLNDALKEMVRQHYYKLSLVSRFYNDSKSIMDVLDEDTNQMIEYRLEDDANFGAYNEILDKIKNDKLIGRKVTVKSLMDTFSKKPYGWRDTDILGMLGVLWKHNAIQFFIHDRTVDGKNRSFKNDFSRKNAIDTMVVQIKENISDDLLYQVKKLMQDAFSYTIQKNEEKLKSETLAFFTAKKLFLENIKARIGNDYPGNKIVTEMYKNIDAVIRSDDSLTIFTELLNRKDYFIANAENLEQIESFYKVGSNQYKAYQEATEIVDWYSTNYMLMNDLESLEPIIEDISAILNLEMPFGKMAQLNTLVFQASDAKKKILMQKLTSIKNTLSKDLSQIELEVAQALAKDLTNEQKEKLNDLIENIRSTYHSWEGSLKIDTQNMDSYAYSSTQQVTGCRNKVTQILSETSAGDPQPRKVTRRIRINDIVPVANKKIKNEADIQKVIDAIKNRLLNELKDADEIDLD